MTISSKKGPGKPAPKKKKGSKNILVTVVAIIIVGAFLAMMVYRPFVNKRETSGPNNGSSLKARVPEFRKDGTLTFHPGDGKEPLTIDIEVVRQEQQIMQGLMYRPQMAENRGMLFIFPGEEERSFWMKNTYIPLDIIFVDANRKIVTIQDNTQPLSTESIPSYKPAKYVVEVNAGFAEKYGIKEGNLISFKF
jgi:uncharacterized membrane protein (UPF0127 family)